MNAHSILEKTQGPYGPQVIHAEETEPGAGNGGSTLQPRLSWQLPAATAARDAGQQAESSLPYKGHCGQDNSKVYVG